MIVDSIKGFERYLHFHPLFSKAYEYMLKTDFNNLLPGEYPVSGREIFCRVWEGEAKGLECPRLEVHDSYIDIHILISGTETIGLRDRSHCLGDNIPYDEREDIAFLEEEPASFVTLAPGCVAVAFPHDAHAPLIGVGKIKKAVIKVLI